MGKKEIISNIIIPAVIDIRDRELFEKYNVNENGYYRQYEGLCNEATTSFINRMNKLNNDIGTNIECKAVHGELKHNPLILSKYWSIQHTWIKMKVDKYTFYIDCTSSQFKWLFKNIPEYYISCKKPKWYISDSKLPEFRRDEFSQMISKYTIYTYDKNGYCGSIPLPVFIRYKIWAKISDFIHRLFSSV
jgi:hypothetical protein